MVGLGYFVALKLPCFELLKIILISFKKRKVFFTYLVSFSRNEIKYSRMNKEKLVKDILLKNEVICFNNRVISNLLKAVFHRMISPNVL